VNKGTTIVVPPRSNQLGIFAAPQFKPSRLLITTDPGCSATNIDGGLKVIGQGHD
jgi:hypothetical protein